MMMEGLPRFACSSEKRPLTGRGFYDARRNVDDSRFPLVGIPTGKVSGIDVVDIDPQGMEMADAIAELAKASEQKKADLEAAERAKAPKFKRRF